MTTTQRRVLVTGGSGFIAGHCILYLLEQGCRVRATARSLEREPQVRSGLTRDGDQPVDDLSFVAAASIIEATAGTYEWLGLRPSWLLAQVDLLADRRPAAEAEVLAANTLSTWLQSWDISLAPGATSTHHSRSKKAFWNRRPSSIMRQK
jgi:nucleoside-diphosphate-sugar epimerase